MSFADLKNKRGKLNFAEMKERLAKAKNGNSFGDEREWKLTVDSNKTGSAIIRFLPPKEENQDPYVLRYSHGIKSNGRWFIEHCPSTIGHSCPVCNYGSDLWRAGHKEEAREYFRTKSYYFNVYIVEDKAHPENEGKVFIYRCGQKIFDIILGAMAPEFSDIEPVNVFDLWDGANFHLRSVMGDGGFASYAKSSFSQPKPLSDDDSYLETVYNSIHDLKTLVADDQFLSTDEMESKFRNFRKQASVAVETPASVDTTPAPSRPVTAEQLEREVTNVASSALISHGASDISVSDNDIINTYNDYLNGKGI